jgi:hypothetical protein
MTDRRYLSVVLTDDGNKNGLLYLSVMETASKIIKKSQIFGQEGL